MKRHRCKYLGLVSMGAILTGCAVGFERDGTPVIGFRQGTPDPRTVEAAGGAVGGILGAFLGPPGVAAGGLATYLLGSVLGRKQGQRSEQAKREEHDRTWDEAKSEYAAMPSRQPGGVV
jgi:membrane protease subunit (stomatin/prohibitin family)